MNYLAGILFVLVGSIDALVLSISYGIKLTKIKFSYNMLISGVACIGTLLAMVCGNVISLFVAARIGNLLGGIILFGLGLKMLVDYLMKKPETQFMGEIVNADIEINKEKVVNDMRLVDVIFLATALSLNNIAIGISASLAELSLLFVSVLSFVFSALFFIIGYPLGKMLKNLKCMEYVDPISAIIIILLGLYVVWC